MTDELHQLIEQSDRILITSHISTDPDAFCSALLLARTIKLNFDSKEVKAVLEEKPTKDLRFLEGSEVVGFANLLGTLKSFKPDLLIIADANQYKRCSRTEYDKMSGYVADHMIKVVIIDHHQPIGADKADIYIRRQSPATVQLIYELFFEELGFKKPKGYAPAAMLGIVSDTLRFKLGITDYQRTFEIVTKLIKDGADIEDLENRVTHFELTEMRALGRLGDNLVVDKGFNYSFIDDDFYGKVTDDKADNDIKSACQLFVNEFVRNIDKNGWGFLIRPEQHDGQRLYAVSFRAKKGEKNVSEIAARLGGGGHIGAAAARIKAKDVFAAIEMVKTAIVSLA